MDGTESWYVLLNGVTVGPRTRAALESMIASGEIGPTTMVWPGSGDWIAASISPLVGAFRATTPPPPPPPSALPPPPPPSPSVPPGYVPAPPAVPAAPRRRSTLATVLLTVLAIIVVIIALDWKNVKAAFMEGYNGARYGRSPGSPAATCDPQTGAGCDTSTPSNDRIGRGNGDTGLLNREISRVMTGMQVEELIKQRSPEGADDETLRRMGAQLATRGLARLDPRMLADRMEIMDHVYRDANEHECANMTRGQAETELLTRTLANYDSATQHRWAVIQISALVAELRAREPVTRPPAEQVHATMNAIGETLNGRDRDRYVEVLQRGAQGSDADVCWFGRAVTKGVLQLAPDSRDHALTTLAEMSAGS